MKVLRFVVNLSFSTILLGSCSACNVNMQTNVEIERLNCNGWDNSYRLSNNDIVVVVIPAIGRNMCFGFKDGKNILWNNPAFFGISLPQGKNNKINYFSSLQF